VALALSAVCRDWYCADSSGERGQSGLALARRLQKVLPDAEVNGLADFDTAMAAALASAGEQRPVLVFGSFTTASAFMLWWQNSHAAKLL
jgi:folylpolyglutamate synthase/dihydropteroate synthase